VLCAPRTATGPLTLEVLDSSKHVLVEKPMAHTIDQAHRLVEAAAARQRIYAVAFMKRYDPGVQAAKTLLEEVLATGRLGKLLFARFYNYSKAYATQPPPHQRPKESRVVRYPVWTTVPDWLPARWQSSYEWFLNSASHDVNLLTYFFPKNVAATSARCLADGSVTSLLSWGDVPITLEIAKTEAGRWLEARTGPGEGGYINTSVEAASLETGSGLLAWLNRRGTFWGRAQAFPWCRARHWQRVAPLTVQLVVCPYRRFGSSRDSPMKGSARRDLPR
jgi:predicted dehydrogenase